MVLSSADFFFQNQLFFFFFVFCFFKSVISEECQAVWKQIMPIWSDLGLICLQRSQQTTLVSKEFMTTIQAMELKQ